jgi:hypothetical protein
LIYKTENNAIRPKIKMTVPDIRFNQMATEYESRPRSSPIPVLSDFHHSEESIKTPETRNAAAA